MLSLLCFDLFFVERSSSPYINRFLSADTIVPGYANPQNLNRYSYVNNNPLRYTDPTGHMLDEGCSTGCGYTSLPTNNYCTNHPWACTGGGGGGGGNSGGSGGGYQPPVVVPDLPCGGMLTCSQQTPYEYAASLLPFTSSDACYFLLHDPILCSSSSWQNFPNVSVTSGPMGGTSPYDEQFPWDYSIPSFFNPGFSPSADDIWNGILGSLPLLGSRPAMNLNQVIINTINSTSNALGNVGSAANAVFGNGPNYGPVMPIFYISSPYDLFPVTSQQPVYN